MKNLQIIRLNKKILCLLSGISFYSIGILFVFLLFSHTAAALNGDTLNLQSNITHVTVFFQGAQISRQLELKTGKGKHLIVADYLPLGINSQSIQVQPLPNCKILSVKHLLNHQSENKKTKDEIAIEENIKSKNQRIKELNNQLKVYEIEEKLILDNSNFKKQNEGASLIELKEAVNYFHTKLNEIRQAKLNLILESDKINEEIQHLNSKLNTITITAHKIFSQIQILIDCEKEINGKMIIRYFINSAGWEPSYDFRVDDINKPLNIVYTANVYQTSGENWDNVSIKLSTNNPRLSGRLPEIECWYAGKKNPYYKAPLIDGVGNLKGNIKDAESGNGLPFATVLLYHGNQLITGTITDINGHYSIKPVAPGNYIFKVSLVGYSTQQIQNLKIVPNQITYQNLTISPSKLELKETEIKNYETPLIMENQSSVSYENHSMSAMKVNYEYNSFDYNNRRNSYTPSIEESSLALDVGKPRVLTSNFIGNTIRSLVTDLEYSIDVPYSIPSDGENYVIRIKESSIPVRYVYHVRPGIDKDVFLKAEIDDWSQLNFLNGKSSLYYQGTFIGESYLDVEKAGDTISLSLGRDRNILVNRTGIKEMNDRKLQGGYFRLNQGWDITIRNTKNTAIDIIIDDQIPISDRKSVSVENLERQGALLDERTGKLTWNMHINASEKAVVSFKYVIKYPKEMWIE